MDINDNTGIKQSNLELCDQALPIAYTKQPFWYSKENKCSYPKIPDIKQTIVLQVGFFYQNL